MINKNIIFRSNVMIKSKIILCLLFCGGLYTNILFGGNNLSRQLVLADPRTSTGAPTPPLRSALPRPSLPPPPPPPPLTTPASQKPSFLEWFMKKENFTTIVGGVSWGMAAYLHLFAAMPPPEDESTNS